MGRVAQFRDVLADILAPRMCVGCRKEGSWLCERCAGAVVREENVTCVGCGRLSSLARTCTQCRPKFPLEGIVAVTNYQDAVVRRIVHAVKYAPARDVVGAFGVLIQRFMASDAGHALRDVIGFSPLFVPVPLHRKRERERGFNQSVEIAHKLVHDGDGFVLSGALVRTVRSVPQMECARAERFDNVRDVFACRENALIRGRTVVIVDDVVTTGATLAACARAIRYWRPKFVWGFALTRD